jgi:alkanesulfonate monooxygenase SsuD/methylene tetrahydromethanopterin reductase-like flavin-dependent oxidoreductase (luciferase family)
MDIDIILEPDVSPQQMKELGIEAERLGIRALWSSNYHMHYDAFLALAPVATATTRLIVGPLAISPWEMHPLKMANAILTLNEMTQGRAMIGVSGGGGVFGALGWKARNDGPGWPAVDPATRKGLPDRRLRATRECIEILQQSRSGKFSMDYAGGVFEIRRPWGMAWARSDGPLIYSCASGPKMIRLGARIAEGIQFSDFTPEMLPAAMANVRAGLAERATPIDDFRIGNFWAWHIKQDRAASMYEARRELIWRGAVVGMIKEDLMPHLRDESEYQLMLEHWDNFRIAFRNRSGNIEGIPDDLANRLISGMSSAGDLTDIDQELERYRQFANGGLTELSLRLFDDPMDGLKMIGEHVLPALRR